MHRIAIKMKTAASAMASVVVGDVRRSRGQLRKL